MREAQWVTTTLGGLPRNCGILVGEHYGVHDRRFYVKMRLIHGESLAQRLARDDAPSVVAAVGMVRKIADIVAVAHQNNAIHRDLKPENVLLEPEGGVQIVDWGCIHLVEAGRVAQSGVGPLCTLGYAPPEQYELENAPSAASDIYALGVMLFELLTGYNPFLGSWRNAGRAVTGANGAGATRTAKPADTLTHAATGLYPTADARKVREAFPDAITRATAVTNVMPLEERLLDYPGPPRSSFARHSTEGFEPVSVAEVLRRQLTFDITRFQALTTAVPERLIQLLAAMLCPRADERPPSMQDVRDRLDSIAELLRRDGVVPDVEFNATIGRRRLAGSLVAGLVSAGFVVWWLSDANAPASSAASTLTSNTVASDESASPVVNAPSADVAATVDAESAAHPTSPSPTFEANNGPSTLGHAAASSGSGTSPVTAADERSRKETARKRAVAERPQPLPTSRPSLADHPYFESQRKDHGR